MTAAQAATIVADLGALKTAVDANNAQIDAAKVDLTALKAAIDANNTAIDSIIAALEAAGIIKTVCGH